MADPREHEKVTSDMVRQQPAPAGQSIDWVSQEDSNTFILVCVRTSVLFGSVRRSPTAMQRILALRIPRPYHAHVGNEDPLMGDCFRKSHRSKESYVKAG